MSLFKKKQIDTPRRRLADNDAQKPNDSRAVFKRNRTLTGSTSSKLNVANVNQSNFESPRAHIHHLADKRRRVFSILSILLLSIIALFLILSNFTAKAAIGLQDVSVSKEVDYSIYEKSIQDYLDINPMSRFHFILNQSALSDYVSSKLPEVMSVEQKGTANFFGTTNFVINMRKPVAGWRINDKQYYVDSKGIPFERNYFASPDVQIVDNSGITPNTGGAVASKRFLSFVGKVVSLSKSNGYTVTQAILPANTTRQLEVKVKEASYSVKLSIDRPAGEQVEDMARALRYFIGNGRKLTYIDVRVSGKAFYK